MFACVPIIVIYFETILKTDYNLIINKTRQISIVIPRSEEGRFHFIRCSLPLYLRFVVSIRPGATECRRAHLCFNPISVMRDSAVAVICPIKRPEFLKYKACATQENPACRTDENVLFPALVSQRTSRVSLSFCC